MLGNWIERLVGALVHRSVEPDSLAHSRHRAFIASHLAGGLAAPVIGAIALVLMGGAGWFHWGALGWLAVPVLIAFYLSRIGDYAAACLLSTLNLAGLACYVAAFTGGMSSFAIVWLVAVPAEAALSGRRGVVAAALVIAIGAIGAVAAADIAGLLPASRIAASNAPGFLAFAIVVATVYVGGIALAVHGEHVRAGQALGASEARYRMLTEYASDLITQHDLDGDVTFATGAAEDLTGRSRRDLLGGGLMDRIAAEDRPVYRAALAAAIEQRRPAGGEFRIVAGATDRGLGPADETRWVEMRCQPAGGRDLADGTVDGVVAVTRDISRLKAQQAALSDARETAESANRAKTFFLANISHELRTPLNAIIGFAEIMKEDVGGKGGDERSGQYAALIAESGAHLLQLVNDLLDMAKIEAGKFTLDPEPFDLNTIVSDCERLMQPSAREAGVTLETMMIEATLPIVADRRACKQILLNLISNAIKFSDDGDRVRIEARREGEGAAICVIDEGAGIPENVLPRLGTPFTQADAAYSRDHQGTGLGLSVVKGLVKLHNGAIEIESGLDAGTRVRVWLPLRNSAIGSETGQSPGRLKSAHDLQM